MTSIRSLFPSAALIIALFVSGCSVPDVPGALSPSKPQPSKVESSASQTDQPLREFHFRETTVPKGATVTRQVRLIYTLQNMEDRRAQRIDLMFHLPPADLPGQYLKRAETSHPGTLITDGMGNRIVRVALDDTAPFETRIIYIYISAVLSDPAALQAPAPDPIYLSEERFIESRHPEITDLARRLAGKTTAETAGNIFRHVTERITPLGLDERFHGALRALRSRQGDCTEMALLFTALCRASGIPARTLTGYVTDRDGVMDYRNLHNWAQFYDRGCWHLADPFYGKFDTGWQNYLAMEIFTGGKGDANQILHLYRFDSHGVKLRLKF